VHVQHNDGVIRGMGLYSPNEAIPVTDVRSWESPGDGHPEPKLRELKERCLTTEDGFVWLGLFEPTRQELDMVAEVFELQKLQIEDAANPHQRPKFEIDEHGHGLALLKVLDYVDSTSDVLTGQLAIFVGPWFAVTVRHGQIGDLRQIRQRIEGNEELRGYGSVSVLYAVLDQVVDGYLAIADEVGLDVENLESQVFAQDRMSTTANQIYRLKRENIEMRRAVGPLLGWAHEAVDERLEWVPPGLRAYFSDIGDHLLRAGDAVESTDNLLMTMLMASTSLQDLQQNRDMRKISAWVAIAAIPTAVAAIYGMNFEYMPELSQPWGYPAVLLLMGGACAFLFRAFKRSGWL
jgi:magnesium transporter